VGWLEGLARSEKFFFPFRFHIIVESFMTKHERALRILLRVARGAKRNPASKH
jgi:hypothetical protein